MRQWARTVLIVERSIPPAERLQHQNRSVLAFLGITFHLAPTHLCRYCDIDTQGNKALVMKQYLSDDQVAEIDEILEMKITHRKNLERRKAKFG